MRKTDLRVLLVPALMLLTSVAAAQSDPGKCSLTAQDYQEQQYVIRTVRFDTPLEWLFGSVGDEVKALLTSPDMPIKAGDSFVKADFDNSFQFIRSRFPELAVTRAQRVRVRIAKPGLENCDAQAKALDVVYHVYTLGFPYYASRAFETGVKDEVSRSVVETSATRALNHYFPTPYGGYDRSRKVFGGSSVSIKQPGGFLDTIELEGSGSTSSALGRAEGLGSRDYGTGLIRHIEYRFRYYYSDMPGQDIKLKQGSGLGQFYAATRSIGPGELVIRLGGLIEGGNKLTDAGITNVAPGDVPSSRFGSIKTFVGANLRIGKQGQAIKASYGLQLGSATERTRLDYVKQIFDSAANLRFPFGDHKAFAADLQFTAGTINTRNQLPVGERFFGGNNEWNFTATDTWQIRSNPVIRSFPQNSFNRNSVNGILGGDRFFSTNATLAVTVWSKPLVPSEIVDDDFNTAAEIGLNFAESTLKTEYLKETSEFKAMAAKIEPLLETLNAVEQELNSVDGPALPQNVKDQMATTRTDLSDALTTARTIKDALKDGAPKTGDIRKLVLGFPAVSADSSVTTVIKDIQALTNLQALPANHLADKIVELEARRKDMADSFTNLSSSPAEAGAESKAKNDMVYPRRVFSQLINEANLIAFSPVLIFDAARLWQLDQPGKTRFAIGPGLRVSVVSLDVTAGFAWNPNRQPWEKRGALFFKMEASNLFR